MNHWARKQCPASCWRITYSKAYGYFFKACMSIVILCVQCTIACGAIDEFMLRAFLAQESSTF
eukprot:scaffold4659_cov73-Attheya_sp.AAC.4